MSRDWKPGDVAMVTWDNESEVRFLVENGTTDVDFSNRKDAWWGRSGYLSIAATGLRARPLVVIDPEDREQVARLLAGYHQWKWEGADAKGASIADMQAALREFATPTPPKPDEPTGLGAVVEDADGERWVRSRSDLPGLLGVLWENAATLSHRDYGDIDVVRVLSAGLAS